MEANEKYIELLNGIQQARRSGRGEEAHRLANTLRRLEPRPPFVDIRLAGELRELGEYDRGVELLRQLLQQHPHTPMAHLGLGLIERHRGNQAAALEAFRSAYRLEPEGNPAFVIELAIALKEQGDLEQAQGLLSALLQRQPDLARARIVLGQVERQRGDRAAALAQFQQGLQLQPDHPMLPVDVAVELRESGRREDALDLLNHFLATHRQVIPAWIALGQTQDQLGEYDAARQAFTNALELNPDHPIATIGLANSLWNMGDRSEANALLEQFVARQPHTLAIWVTLIGHLRLQKDHAKVRDHVCRAYRLFPEEPKLLLELALDLVESGDLELAEGLFLELRIVMPDSAAIIHQLARIAIFRDDHPAAERWYREGIERHPEAAICYQGLATEYMAYGAFDAALEVIDQGLAEVTHPIDLQRQRARLLKVRGDLDNAWDSVQRLRAEHPGDFGATTLAVEIAKALGLFDEAAGLLADLRATNDGQHFSSLIQYAQLTRAQFDLEKAVDYAQEALSIKSDALDGRYLLALIQVMRGRVKEARSTLKLLIQQYRSHPSSRVRDRANGGLVGGLIIEAHTNPFAEQALRSATELPLEQQPAAITQVLRDEPGHIASGWVLLIALTRLGVWQREALATNPSKGDEPPRIPRRIVQFWNNADIPDDILAAMQSWPRACLGFEHQVFNDHSAEAFLIDAGLKRAHRAFRMANHPAMRSDIFRLAYLWERGGLYTDADDLCRHSLEQLLDPGVELFVSQEDIGSIGNNLLAAVPRHPWIGLLLEQVVTNVLERQGDNIWFVSGPGTVTWSFCHHYLEDLAQARAPRGVRLRTVYQLGQWVSMHIPRSYKQDARHWSSPQAAPAPLYGFGFAF